MIRLLSASAAAILLLSSCGHMTVNHSTNAAIAEAELQAAVEQVQLARELAAAGEPARAAQAYRAALELIPPGELPEAIQVRAEQLADSVLAEYHALLSAMPALPDETPAWAVVAEMDSTGPGPGMYAVSGDSAAYDMPVVMNDRVARVITYFTTKGRKPFTVWLERMGMYEEIIRPILREHGLPQDLIYLAMIESGFNTRAQSYARAVGPWQFISGTARKYGLRVTWWVDERRDVVKSTHAACRYLKALHEQFGSWELALAAYNCGEGKVDRHIKKHKTDDFWKLNRLPRQTRNYVPTFMGAMIIAKAPQDYGFSVEPLSPLEWEEVELEECTSLDVAARCAGSTVEELEILNPELRKRCTPPDERYTLRLPKGSAEQFLAEYAEIPDEEKVTWAHHRVTRGQTLSLIARRYGTTVEAIKEFNGLRSTHLIREGADLVIPVPRGASTASAMPSYYSGEETSYRVRRGDTLGKIASRFGVSVRQLCEWNEITTRTTIYPGQTLQLWPETTPPSAGATVASDPDGVTGVEYRVRPGDTLGEIARRYGVSIDSIRRANRIRGSLIRAGQSVLIPGVSAPASEPRAESVVLAEAPSIAAGGDPPSDPAPSGVPSASTASSAPISYTVRRGDTLEDIARRHGTSVAALRRANAISGSIIYPGQVLSLRRDEAPVPDTTYIVRRGDSLARIAARFGVSVAMIQRANGIRGSLIHPGQRIAVPSQGSSSRDRLVYTVRRGDSLSAIARRFGVSIAELEAWNDLARGAVLYPGTTLSIQPPPDAPRASLGG